MGHLVKITNEHGGLKGELAYVTKVTNKMVWLELYESNKKIGNFIKKKCKVTIVA